MSIFSTCFARNLITKTKACLFRRYHLSVQVTQNAGRNANTLHTKPVQFNNFLKLSPVCVEILTKPLPLLEEPVNKSISQVLDMPLSPLCVPLHIDILDPPPKTEIEEPSNNTSEKRAARLIVIRRRKMKKHKLRKLRKKMKFEWAKVRQRRELRKEKLFQAKLVAQISQGEKFDATEYVSEKLRKMQNISQPKAEVKHRQSVASNRNRMS